MPRPSDEQIRSRVYAFSSNEQGSCQAVSKDLKLKIGWGGFEKPVKKGVYCTYIDRGYPEDHWEFWAQWEGEDVTVIDATIGQFGSEEQIFIGTQPQWFERISHLCNCAPVVMDVGGKLFSQAHYRNQDAELAARERKAAYDDEIDAQWEGSRVAILASRESHIVRTMRRGRN